MTNAEQLKKLRAEAVAAGLCQQCRCRPQKPGCVTCQHCLGKAKERAEAYKAVGLCDCGREPSEGRTFCEVCLKAQRKRNRRSRRVRRAKGICSMCVLPAEPGRSMCARHLKYQAERVGEIRSAYLAVGLCQCGRDPRPGLKTCDRCIKYDAEYHARWVERQKQLGLCVHCKQPAAPGRVRCERHLAKRRRAA